MNRRPALASVSERLAKLLGGVYEGPSEAMPWQAFAEGLRADLGARNVMVTLHHVQGEGRDTYVKASLPDDEIDWAAVEAVYRAQFMQADPLRPDLMQPGQIALLDTAALDSARRSFLNELGLSQCLRACVAAPSGLRCWVDVLHGHAQPQTHFTGEDLALMRELLPHLARALQLFARINRQESERAIYAAMVEHFALGCMLLNEGGELIHVNGVAADISKRWPGLAMGQGRLLLQDRETRRQFDEAFAAVLQSRQTGSRYDGAPVRLDDGHGHLLGLLICPAPVQHYYQGAQAPSAIVYLCELSAGLDALRPTERASLDRIVQLFGLTQQEARLALLLGYGHTIAEAAREMSIAEIAARNYSKKIYAKLDISGQTELVRLMLRSISFLQ